MNRHLSPLMVMAVALLVMPAKVHAGPNTYSCTIEGWHTSSPDTFDWIFEDAQHETIQINRDTGQVFHSRVGNTSFNEIYLLNRGSREWSFKVFADSGRQLFGQGNNGGHTHYFEVHEYAEGRMKPFIGVDGGFLFWGTCS